MYGKINQNTISNLYNLVLSDVIVSIIVFGNILLDPVSYPFSRRQIYMPVSHVHLVTLLLETVISIKMS